LSVCIQRLSKSWGDFAIRNIDLDVENGEYFVLLGPTGAGKTLLLETIAGFHKPDTGEIWINGKNVTSLPPEKRSIGLVPQQYMIFPHMTVKQNVEFGLKIRKVPKTEREKAVNEVLELVGLTHRRNRFPSTLSGGEQQKTALARALVIKPKILLLDEPLSALDVNTQKRLREELKAIHEELGITTIHVTHNHFEAHMLADKVAIMKNGAIVQKGLPEEVFRRPKNDFVAEFVGFENLFEGKILATRGGLATIDLGGVTVEAVTSKRGKCMVGVRPDDIILSNSLFQSSMRNVLKGRVTGLIDMGAIVNVVVKVKNVSFTALITKRSLADMGLAEGKEVYLAFKASAVHVL